jgi:hypothetical protein
MLERDEVLKCEKSLLIDIPKDRRALDLEVKPPDKGETRGLLDCRLTHSLRHIVELLGDKHLCFSIRSGQYLVTSLEVAILGPPSIRFMHNLASYEPEGACILMHRVGSYNHIKMLRRTNRLDIGIKAVAENHGTRDSHRFLRSLHRGFLEPGMLSIHLYIRRLTPTMQVIGAILQYRTDANPSRIQVAHFNKTLDTSLPIQIRVHDIFRDQTSVSFLGGNKN